MSARYTTVAVAGSPADAVVVDTRPRQRASKLSLRERARAELELRHRRGEELARSMSLAQFVREAWHVLEPATPLVWGWHIDAICEHLEAVTAGKIRRLVINVPPGHMKSLLVSVFWPSWMWLRDPSLRLLATTGENKLTLRDATRMRDLVTSSWYEETFSPRWRIRRDQRAKGEYQNTATGFRKSVSVGGMTTGFRGHGIVIDDPIGVAHAHSDAKREAAVDYVTTTLPTRLNDPRTGWQVLIMQRLHEMDPAGVLLSRGGWEHLCLPSEYDPEIASETSIGWRDPRTEPGQILFPEQFPAEVLADLRTTLGSAAYAGQHGQRPAPAGGLIFQRHWFRLFESLPADIDEWAQSWDFTFGAQGDDASYVCGAVWARRGAEYYRVWEVRERMTMPAMLEAMRAATQRFPKALTKWVEKKANGAAIIDLLQGEIPGIVPVEPRGSKVARAHAVSPVCEAGNVYVPARALWLDAWLGEMTSFPRAAANDRVDETTQALSRLSGRANWSWGDAL